MTTDQTKSAFSRFASLPFRPGQGEAVDFCLNSSKKFSIVCAPTGSGKSLIGMSIISGKESGIYTVHSKPLQLQIEHDFPESTVLFGRSNYPCQRDWKRTHEECRSTKMSPCSLQSSCPYKVKKRKALSSPYPVLNYAYLFSELNYVGKFSCRPVIVIDEADSLENSLYQFISLSISARLLDQYDITVPDYITLTTSNGLNEWKSWGVETYDYMNRELSKQAILLDNYSGDDDGYDRLSKTVDRLSGLVTKLSIFNEYLDHTWMLDVRPNYYGTNVYHFRPLWLTKELTDKYLWSHSSKFVLMSATFPPLEVLGKVLGIQLSQADYIEIPSTFNPERRVVHVKPIANLTAATMTEEIPKVVEEVRSILALHSEDKGLIHTVSYSLSQAIMKINNPRLITHNSKDKIEVLEYFRASDDPLVLVSPSSERGISLEHDTCRFIIIAKAPYLSLGDKAVKSRVYSSQIGKVWYRADMALTSVQASGRGMRSANDYCTTYILDKQLADLIRSKPSYFPKWFRDSIEFDY